MNQYIKNQISKKLTVKQKQFLLIVFSKIKLFFYKKDICKNTYIDKTVHVTGWNSLSIGHNSLISEYTWLNVNQRIPSHKHIIIGNNCYIGRRNFFSSGWQIDIGDYVMTGIDCKLIGSDHIFDSPLKPYSMTGTTNNKIIKLGVNVWLGAGVMILGNVTVGHGSIIGAGTLVTKNIPPFSIAVGNPCKIIKRFDFNQNNWIPIEQYDESVQKVLKEEDYKILLTQQYPILALPLQASSRRAGDLF